jgi:predicted nucleic acid-binding protein
LVGPILQELLDGVKDRKHFDLLREYLAPFPLLELARDDFVEASRLRNKCRSHGVQASPTDFLICAACVCRNYPLLSADNDFKHISAHCDIDLIAVHS